MTGGITFSGLASGIDSGSIITQLMQLERIPITRLESKKKTYQNQASKWRSVKTKLTALEDAAKTLASSKDVLKTKVSSSDEKVFKASGSSTAALGPTSIHVTSLATVEKMFSDSFATEDQTGLFGEGTLSIQVGAGDTVDVEIDATDTLASVASKISASGAKVSAGVIFDGTNYRLRVSGNETGAANDITFTQGGTLDLGLDDAANQLQAASDAAFTIDGMAMTRARNTFADAVPGVSITLTGVSEGTTAATLDVQRDADSLVDGVQKLVDKYNDLVKSMNNKFAFSGAAKGADSLNSDSALRGLQSRLRGMIGGVIPGLTGSYDLLAQVGIDTTQTGEMKLERSKLEEALATDPSSVAHFFAGNSTSGVKGFSAQLGSLLDEYTDSSQGIISMRINSLEGRGDDIDDQIARMELRLDKTEENLRKQYAALEQTVSGLQNQGNQMLAALVGLSG